jgi:hypothetical protein
MDHSVLLGALAEDALELLVDGQVLLAREGLLLLLLLLLLVVARVHLLAEPLLVRLPHLLQTVRQRLADLLHLALLLLREDQVALAGDGTLQDALVDQLANQLADGSLLQLELGSQTAN